MNTNDTELISVEKPGKKSLLQRYEIPVEHLSYEYISECKNGKVLERIVTILRSGEEGFYPDLTKHAEKHLALVKPTSIILRKSEPVVKSNMLEPNERQEIDKDIGNWTSEMQSREKDLEEGKATLLTEHIPQPDVRQFIEEPAKKQTLTKTKTVGKTNRISTCDYAAWDKYDVDTELSKIDIRDERKRVEDKKFQQKQKEINEERKRTKDTIINTSSLTGTELDFLADQEKEKGNEAFRAGDYEEALEHYSTSIKMNSNTTSYNNRAMTHIKLQRYQDALNDCNHVLYLDCSNIKALLRRAVTFEHLEKSSEALADYEAVLMLESTNAMAIAAVKKLRKPCTSRKVRMTIEEQTEDTLEVSNITNSSTQSESNFNIGNSICYCDRAPSSSKNLGPRPHLKADYCFENEVKQKSLIKNDSSTKSELDYRKNIFGPPKISTTFTTTKSKSIFSCSVPNNRDSSVIIEELPNDFCNNNSIDGKNNETVGNKSNSNAKVVNKNKTSDKKVSAFNAKNVNKNHEQGRHSNEKRNEKLSPKKIQIAEKYKTKVKSERRIPQNFNDIENPYEFMRAWQSLKNYTDLEAHANLLRAMKMDKLTAVLGIELDGSMFSTILRCLERHFCTPTDKELVNDLLRSICQVKRFSIVNMFMDAEDKQAVKNILNFLEEHGTSGVSSLRQIYCI